MVCLLSAADTVVYYALLTQTAAKIILIRVYERLFGIKRLCSSFVVEVAELDSSFNPVRVTQSTSISSSKHALPVVHIRHIYTLHVDHL